MGHHLKIELKIDVLTWNINLLNIGLMQVHLDINVPELVMK